MLCKTCLCTVLQRCRLKLACEPASLAPSFLLKPVHHESGKSPIAFVAPACLLLGLLSKQNTLTNSRERKYFIPYLLTKKKL